MYQGGREGLVVAYHRVSLEAVFTDPKPFVEAQACSPLPVFFSVGGLACVARLAALCGEERGEFSSRRNFATDSTGARPRPVDGLWA